MDFSSSGHAVALARAIIDHTPLGRSSLGLEVGTGSGRVTRPLWAEKARLYGLDLSHDKLLHLVHQASGRLIQADGMKLPFANDVFDIVVTVRFLHLLSDPVKALFEFRRILRPHGLYLRGVDRVAEHSVWSMMRRKWESILAENEYPQFHKERDAGTIDGMLSGAGARSTTITVCETIHQTSPRKELERISTRIHQGAWLVPEGKVHPLLNRLRCWAEANIGPLDTELSYRATQLLQVWTFPDGNN